ncbi:cytoplasmic tRNA 2-thiolation protein 2B [Rhizoctonia solani]|uniref:Cytoplasmic tRNA 2-thiolation protein 2B n=1 Tax=Rhizoctonia solani TaxID=456999 RepID=A0A8H8NQ42_9AGAM|nr:cytoplasmic tRNA 2-thiolation protein 2B [Rhizoctonia solani]QRW17926.1 cytoplasmic tRNA 2-thiolation protein 2B [Rhizoctonia solani]
MSCEDPSARPELMPRILSVSAVGIRIFRRALSSGTRSIAGKGMLCDSVGPQVPSVSRTHDQPTSARPAPGSRGVSLRPVLKAAGDLLVGFSARLDPARGTKAKSKRENVWPTARVAFIDISAAYPGEPVLVDSDRTEDARRLVARYPHFTFIPLRIENAFDPNWANSVGFPLRESSVGIDVSSEDLPATRLPPETNPTEALHLYLSSQPSSSARTTALRNITRLLLQYTARHTKSSHLLLGGSLTSYAVDLLDAVATGAGFSIRQVGEETWEGIRIVRSLREITDKEVAAGCWWRRVEIMPATVMAREDNGITRLTKAFITGLDRDFPSTVHTIARTCEKLAPKGGTSDSNCPLCARPIQPGVQAWKAQIAIRTFEPELRESPLSSSAVNPEGGHPRSDTHPGSDSVSTNESLLPPESGSRQTTEPILSSTTPTLAPLLCYACHTQLTSRGRVPVPKHTIDQVALPVWVRPENVLRDYLLESE